MFGFVTSYLDHYPENSWVVREQIENSEISDQYIRSLYWTITTMTTVGYGDISPDRNIEYVVSMIVMLIGASMYAFIIGNIASLFSNLDAAKANYWNRIEAISRYLRHHQVPPELNTRINKLF